jgi:hypothetical protein
LLLVAQQAVQGQGDWQVAVCKPAR